MKTLNDLLVEVTALQATVNQVVVDVQALVDAPVVTPATDTIKDEIVEMESGATETLTPSK